MFDLIGKGFDAIASEVGEFVDDPIGKTIHTTLAPVRHSVNILEGLTEGEIRTKAALSLGVDVVSGMALSEVVEYLLD